MLQATLTTVLATLFFTTGFSSGNNDYKQPIKYAGPIIYSDEKPPIIHFPPPPLDIPGGASRRIDKTHPIKYVPLPHHELPVLIYQSDNNPPIHVVHPPPDKVAEKTDQDQHDAYFHGFPKDTYIPASQPHQMPIYKPPQKSNYRPQHPGKYVSKVSFSKPITGHSLPQGTFIKVKAEKPTSTHPLPVKSVRPHASHSSPVFGSPVKTNEPHFSLSAQTRHKQPVQKESKEQYISLPSKKPNEQYNQNVKSHKPKYAPPVVAAQPHFVQSPRKERPTKVPFYGPPPRISSSGYQNPKAPIAGYELNPDIKKPSYLQPKPTDISYNPSVITQHFPAAQNSKEPTFSHIGYDFEFPIPTAEFNSFFGRKPPKVQDNPYSSSNQDTVYMETPVKRNEPLLNESQMSAAISTPVLLSTKHLKPPTGATTEAMSSFRKPFEKVPTTLAPVHSVQPGTYGPPIAASSKASPPHIIYAGHPPIHIYEQPTAYSIKESPLVANSHPIKKTDSDFGTLHIGSFDKDQLVGKSTPDNYGSQSALIPTYKVPKTHEPHIETFSTAKKAQFPPVYTGHIPVSEYSYKPGKFTRQPGQLATATSTKIREKVPFRRDFEGTAHHMPRYDNGNQDQVGKSPSHIRPNTLPSRSYHTHQQSSPVPVPVLNPEPVYIPAPKGLHKPPIIIYQGVRPPVHVYQKPDTTEIRRSFQSAQKNKAINRRQDKIEHVPSYRGHYEVRPIMQGWSQVGHSSYQDSSLSVEIRNPVENPLSKERIVNTDSAMNQDDKKIVSAS